MTLGVSEVARLLGVDRDVVKSWVYHFAEHLSAIANPGKGVPRRFTPEDVQVLAYVSMYWEDDPDLESIRRGLNCGNHEEEPFRDIRIELTPLFQQPPEELDETWDWGTLIGGIAGGTFSRFDLAEAFRFAGDRVADEVVGHPERYLLINPMLFSYRHATELYLKAALASDTQTHELALLLEQLRTCLKSEFGAAIPRWFETVILEFDDFDPISTTFRYGDSGFFSRRTGDTGEFWIDVPHVKKRMAQLSEAFHRILRAQADAISARSTEG